MIKLARITLGLIALASLVAQAGAQSDTPFPDTKKNHWAYQAVLELKVDGLLPHGHYEFGMGMNLFTRDEFAQATIEGLARLEEISKHLDAEVADANVKIAQLGRLAKSGEPADVQVTDLLKELNGLLDEEDGYHGYVEYAQLLKRLEKAFEPDITARGGDPKAISRDLDRLYKRFSRMPVTKRPDPPPFQITTKTF